MVQVRTRTQLLRFAQLLNLPTPFQVRHKALLRRVAAPRCRELSRSPPLPSDLEKGGFIRTSEVTYPASRVAPSKAASWPVIAAAGKSTCSASPHFGSSSLR
jgi:hypothetical protein